MTSSPTEQERPVSTGLLPSFRYRVETCAPGEAPYTLALTFNVPGEEGQVRVFDVTPYLDRGVFRELRDETYFRRVRLDRQFGTVEWPNGQDFDPAALYAYSQPLP